MNFEDYSEDRKRNGKDKIRYKSLMKNPTYKDDSIRDNRKIKNRLKSKIEEMRQEEIWEDWEDEIS